MIPTIWYYEEQKFSGTEERERDRERNSRGFFKQETYYGCYDNGICYSIFVQTHKMFNTKNEP
jgi:hypothetical protein